MAKPLLPCFLFLIIAIMNSSWQTLFFLYMYLTAIVRLCLISPHGLAAAFLQVTLNLLIDCEIIQLSYSSSHFGIKLKGSVRSYEVFRPPTALSGIVTIGD